MNETDKEKLREEFLAKFPSMLEVQLHGFGVEVDEVFNWFISKIESSRNKIVAELDTLWVRNHETPEKLQKALEDWINYQTDDDLPQDGKEIK